MNFETTEQALEFLNSLDIDKCDFVYKNDGEDCGCGGGCECGGTGDTCSCNEPNDEIKFNFTKEGSNSLTVNVDTVKVNSPLIIESFTDSPEFEVVINETKENIFLVNDFSAVPNYCGTGQIELDDRTTTMNMCEMDNKATVKLNIAVESLDIKSNDVEFTLQKTDGTPKVILSSEWCNSILNRS
tara:strand:- start:167 stop:721 length:555 start_codon:yes stop_codon:yes gene_type:complete